MSRPIVVQLLSLVEIAEEGGLIPYGLIILSHFIYSIFTFRITKIKVMKKYNYNTYGFTNFMIVDANGKHYKVNNSLWYNKWDSIETYNDINIDDEITIKYYGYRIPILGLFPNIFSSKKL